MREKNLAFNYTVGCIEYCCAIALLSMSFCVATLAYYIRKYGKAHFNTTVLMKFMWR